MKKFAYLVLALVAVTTVSCETCMTCTYQKFNSEEEVTEEVCGNKDETGALVKEYEDSSIAHRSEYHCIENY